MAPVPGRQGIVLHPWQLVQDGMYGSAQRASTLAMYDSYIENARFPTGRQVFRDQFGYLSGVESVKVELVAKIEGNGIRTIGKLIILPGMHSHGCPPARTLEFAEKIALSIVGAMAASCVHTENRVCWGLLD